MFYISYSQDNVVLYVLGFKMNLEEYYEKLDYFAQRCIQKNVQPHEFIEQAGEDEKNVSDCVDLRTALLSSEDKENFTSCLPVGFFLNKNTSTRLACFALISEIDALILKKR